MIDGKEAAFHSKNLIQRMRVDAVKKEQVEERKRDVDFEHMKQVLVQEYGFHSLEKVIDELKKQIKGGEQLSLFG